LASKEFNKFKLYIITDGKNNYAVSAGVLVMNTIGAFGIRRIFRE